MVTVYGFFFGDISKEMDVMASMTVWLMIVCFFTSWKLAPLRCSSHSLFDILAGSRVSRSVFFSFSGCASAIVVLFS